MQFGVFDQNDFNSRGVTNLYEERLKLIELYEANGFHRYFMSEHHGTPLSTMPSPSVFLSAVAQRTSRMRFGPLVYLLPLYHPLRLAEEICMLDNLSNGRFEFGVGKGASPFEVGYFGVTPDHAPAMYQEVLDFILPALRTGRMDGKGKYWSFDDVHLSLTPVQRPMPQVWYAVGSPESAVKPAKLGMNIVCAGPASRIREIVATYNGAHAQPENALAGMARYIVIADTDEEAMTLANRAWKAYYANFINLWERYETPPAVIIALPDLNDMIAIGQAVVGSPETVASILRSDIDETGVNYLSGTFVFGDMTFDEASRSINLFASEIMPQLQPLAESPDMPTAIPAE